MYTEERVFPQQKIKVPVNSVRWNCTDEQVHCFISIDVPSQCGYDKLYEIMSNSYTFERDCACNPQYNWNNKIWKPRKISQSKNCIYNPSHYEFHGAARLKDGDKSNVTLAKSIAYKKAYRQALKFYINQYYNMYSYLMDYAEAVWYDQIAQLSDRIIEVDNEISDLTDN